MFFVLLCLFVCAFWVCVCVNLSIGIDCDLLCGVVCYFGDVCV